MGQPYVAVFTWDGRTYVRWSLTVLCVRAHYIGRELPRSRWSLIQRCKFGLFWRVDGTPPLADRQIRLAIDWTVINAVSREVMSLLHRDYALFIRSRNHSVFVVAV